MSQADSQGAIATCAPFAFDPGSRRVVHRRGLRGLLLHVRVPQAVHGGDVSPMRPCGGSGRRRVLVTAQVLGYTVAKFIGIRVIAEMPPQRRAAGILVLIGEGRGRPAALRHRAAAAARRLPVSERAVAGDGVRAGDRVPGGSAEHRAADGGPLRELHPGRRRDQVGRHVAPEPGGDGALDARRWPGLIFVPPLLVFVWMLTRIPPPDADDVAHRSERRPMDRHARMDFLRRHGVGLFCARGGLPGDHDRAEHPCGLRPRDLARARGEDGPRDVFRIRRPSSRSECSSPTA